VGLRPTIAASDKTSRGIGAQPEQDVKMGEVIGLVGSTGFVTGPHLHLEVRIHNQPVEPQEWLQRPPFERPDLAAL
jgi:murein DD-endopeptidase MepM/ murein hydrolase activator NlpD